MTDMDQTTKVRANRLRRAADRQGFVLSKSAARDPRAIDYDRWLIIDPDTNEVVHGGDQHGRHTLTLDQVEDWLLS